MESSAFVGCAPVMRVRSAGGVRTTKGRARRVLISRSIRKTAKGTRKAVANRFASTRNRLKVAAEALNKGLQVAALMALVALLGIILSLLFPAGVDAALNVSQEGRSYTRRSVLSILKWFTAFTAASRLLSLRRRVGGERANECSVEEDDTTAKVAVQHEATEILCK